MKKILVITYYWPPSGGSGVQRWMYFCKYLPLYKIQPVVITVDEKKASYKSFDYSFNEKIRDTEVYKTMTSEPLRFYSWLISGDKNKAIPVGISDYGKTSFFQKVSRAIRGNLYIPDARKGWIKYAFRKASEIIRTEEISLVVTTSPPNSSHFIGKKLKEKFGVKWIADFRDPWSEIYYNKQLYRFRWAQKKDEKYEKEILQTADFILTIGPSMKDHLVKRGLISPDKIDYIYNGFDQDVFENLLSQKDKEKFVITHIGVLGDNQPVTSFLAALKKFLTDHKDAVHKIKLLLVGNVSEKNIREIREMVPEIAFELKEYVPQQEAIRYMMNSNLLLNSLAVMDNSQMLISGKLMEYIATGNPIICLGDEHGDAANLLTDIDNAKVFDRKNQDAMQEFLYEIYNLWKSGKNNNDNKKQIMQYSRKSTALRLAEVIKQKMG